MSRPIHTQHHPREVQLSAVHLSTRVRLGETVVAYGMHSDRHHQAERRTVLPSWHVAFVHPPLRTSARPNR